MIQTTIWFKIDLLNRLMMLQKEGGYEQFYGGIHYRAAIENGLYKVKK
jgi:hypothetical protein